MDEHQGVRCECDDGYDGKFLIALQSILGPNMFRPPSLGNHRVSCVGLR